MSRTPDEIFVDTFMGILGALVLFTVAVAVLANAISARTIEVSHVNDSAMQAAMVERIAPIGDALADGEPAPAPKSAPPKPLPAQVVAAESRDGETVYNMACLACHGVGVAGAPKSGDAEAWAPRIAQGLDTLSSHAINGYTGSAGYMPAKGGNTSLSDDEVSAAVEYMVNQSQ